MKKLVFILLLFAGIASAQTGLHVTIPPCIVFSDEDNLLGCFRRVNFLGDGVECVVDSNTIDCTVSGGSGTALTLEDPDDSNPSIANVDTIWVPSSGNLILTDEGGGTARIEVDYASLLTNIPKLDEVNQFTEDNEFFGDIEAKETLQIYEEVVNGNNFLAFNAPGDITSNQTCLFEDDSSFIPDSCVGDGTDDIGISGLTFEDSAAVVVNDVTYVVLTSSLKMIDDGGGQITLDTDEGQLEAILDIAGDVDGTGLTAVDLDEVAVEAELESVIDLQDLQGAVTDGQVPNNITIDLATNATNLAANPTDCGAGEFANAIDAQGDLTCATPSGSSFDRDTQQNTWEDFNCGGNTYATSTTTGKFTCETEWDYASTSTGTVVAGTETTGTIQANRATLFTVNGGTNATGAGCIYKPVSFYVGGGSPGDSAVRMEFAFSINVLSDATNRFGITIGANSQAVSSQCNSGSASSDSIYFFYRDNVNSGNWLAVTTNGGTQSTADTGIAAAADTWCEAAIEILSDGSSVDFFMDCTAPFDTTTTAIATITTNIPTGDDLGYIIQTVNAGGTSGTRRFYVDYFLGEVTFDDAR